MVRRPLHAKILEVHSGTRARIFGALIAEPDRAWRVSQLAALLPDVSIEAVRTTLYLLLGERMVQPVPHNRSLTLRMTDEGRSAIELIRRAWAASGSGEGRRSSTSTCAQTSPDAVAPAQIAPCHTRAPAHAALFRAGLLPLRPGLTQSDAATFDAFTERR